jgi:hypothetical protein
MNALAEQPNGLPEILVGDIVAGRSNGAEPEACRRKGERIELQEKPNVTSTNHH